MAEHAQDPTVESLIREEVAGLRREVAALAAGHLSAEEAASVLSWAKEVEDKVKAVAAVMGDPGPVGVATYLRAVASGTASTRSRRFTSSSLLLLQAALRRLES